jgi:hypothetical protein
VAEELPVAWQAAGALRAAKKGIVEKQSRQVFLLRRAEWGEQPVVASLDR